jgi:hypothetical protein
MTTTSLPLDTSIAGAGTDCRSASFAGAAAAGTVTENREPLPMVETSSIG